MAIDEFDVTSDISVEGTVYVSAKVVECVLETLVENVMHRKPLLFSLYSIHPTGPGPMLGRTQKCSLCADGASRARRESMLFRATQ